MAFDPDAFLAEETIETPQTDGFDPDTFLADIPPSKSFEFTQTNDVMGKSFNLTKDGQPFDLRLALGNGELSPDEIEEIKALSTPDMLKAETEQGIRKAITGAQVAGAFTPASPLFQGSAVFTKQKIDGASTEDAAKAGVKAVLTDMAFIAGGGMLGKGIGKVPGLSKALGKNALRKLGLSDSFVNRVARNPKLLDKPTKSAPNMAKLFSGSIDDINSSLGKKVGATRLKAADIVDPKPAIKILKERAKAMRATGLKTSTSADLNTLDDFISALSKKDLSSEIAQDIMENLTTKAKFKDASGFSPLNQSTTKALQGARTSLRKAITKPEELVGNKDLTNRMFAKARTVLSRQKNLAKTDAAQSAIENFGSLKGERQGDILKIARMASRANPKKYSGMFDEIQKIHITNKIKAVPGSGFTKSDIVNTSIRALVAPVAKSGIRGNSVVSAVENLGRVGLINSGANTKQ